MFLHVMTGQLARYNNHKVKVLDVTIYRSIWANTDRFLPLMLGNWIFLSDLIIWTFHRWAGEQLSQNFLGHSGKYGWIIGWNKQKRTHGCRKMLLKALWRNGIWPYLPVFKIPLSRWHFCTTQAPGAVFKVMILGTGDGGKTPATWWNKWLLFKIIDPSKWIMPILAN